MNVWIWGLGLDHLALTTPYRPLNYRLPPLRLPPAPATVNSLYRFFKREETNIRAVSLKRLRKISFVEKKSSVKKKEVVIEKHQSVPIGM